MAGLRTGYWARVGEENERWRESVHRLDVVETERFVRIDGRMIRVWSWRDRAANRENTLREGHAAGLHESRWPVLGCPVCCPDVHA